MKFENKTLRNINSYIASSPKAQAYSSDSEVLKLDWNESTINPSPEVFKAINASIISKKWNWYPDINNIKLKKAIALYSNVEYSQI